MVRKWLYDNENGNTISGLNYSGLTIVDTQHFEFGNEDIEFDMTNEINDILSGATTGVTGYGIAFVPEVENITGMTENYSVGFFSRHTQTFYEPYLETNYNDLIQDDRYTFYEGVSNKLYLYAYVNGNPITLDNDPVVDIIDENDDVIHTLTGCSRTKGVYEITVPAISSTKYLVCITITWRELNYNGESIHLLKMNLYFLRMRIISR